jgi:hypothetical protein
MDKAAVPTVVAVFDERGQAESAIDELWHQGFAHDHLGIVMPGGRVTEATTATEQKEERAARGAVGGAVTGGALGAIAGAAVASVVPGVGPVLAGGILAGAVTGLAAGAAIGVFAGPFVALGLSEADAQAYERAFRAGRTILTVQAEPQQVERVLMILRSHGGHDIKTAPGALAEATH